MNKFKNIGFNNLDDDLKNKIESFMNYYNGAVSGATPSSWQALVGNINTSLTDLKRNKADTSNLVHYFNKDNEKITKNMLDPELSAIATSLEQNKYRKINDKIAYADLASDTTNRIERTENRLDYINNYILSNGINSSGASNITDKLFQDTISSINKKIDDNKDDADNKIASNANDIAALQKKTSDLQDIADNLDNKYQKNGQLINYSDLPIKAQETINKLSDSLAFTQTDKDLLNSLSSSKSINLIIGSYTGNDTKTLESYIKNEFKIIYHIITGASTQKGYIVKYELVDSSDPAQGTATNATQVLATADSSTVIPLFQGYKSTLLTDEESTNFQSSLIYSSDSRKLYFNDTLLSQRPSRLIDQDISISKGAAETIDTSDVLESSINTNIFINIKDANGNIYDGSHLVSITRHQDKIELTNETDEDITVNVVIKDYMI